MNLQLKPSDARLMGSVARLLEFYRKQELHAFFHAACDEHECDVVDVFFWLEEELVYEYLCKGKDVPPFRELASRYARLRGWQY